MKPFSLLATAILLFASQESTNLYSSEINDQNTQQEATQEAAPVEIAQTTTVQADLQIQNEESKRKELVLVKAVYQSDSEDLGDDQGYWIWVDKDSGTATKANGKNPNNGNSTKKVSDSSSKQNNKQMQMDMATSSNTQTAWMGAADFLWWSSNDNIISAVDANLTGTQNNSNLVNANLHIKHPPSTWDPGVRLTLGYMPGYDHWDIQGAWTFFYNSADSSLIPLKVSADGDDVGFTGGGTKFSFQYNAADLVLGKSYFISRSFFIRPFTGIHAIWTDIDGHYRLLSGGDIFSTGDTADEAIVNLGIDAWGVGPVVGFNTNWGQFKGFSLIGNIAGSLVYGQTSGKGSIDLTISSQEIDINLNTSSFWQLMPTLQIQFGLSYCTYFGESDNQFRVNAMWESNFIWEAANVLIFDRSISMQGLTLSFGLVF